ncbi:hypothetical protein C8A00DRAFT_18496 [Chaetomidium leptoderma]|uniref:Secreted protein n=1 Tax=Chaetomidium leptoderma TaxID=669021 RepID=A0AAN6ZS61_9PEZI|nr:hypothetical protein C8A00DRAFT_18496 [Chaetomidium leptoderma]
MRLPTLAVLAPLVTLAVADYMEVNTFCNSFACTSHSGRWHSGYGTYSIDANEGCRDPPDVPGMYRICMDWKSGRGHFLFDRQAKRCLRKTEDKPYRCDDPGWCTRSVWSEVACAW